MSCLTEHHLDVNQCVTTCWSSSSSPLLHQKYANSPLLCLSTICLLYSLTSLYFTHFCFFFIPIFLPKSLAASHHQWNLDAGEMSRWDSMNYKHANSRRFSNQNNKPVVSSTVHLELITCSAECCL